MLLWVKLQLSKNGIIDGTKFDRLRSYRMANLHYLVVEGNLLGAHEVPTGWGLLVRDGEELRLAGKPAWQDIDVEQQLIFLQRIPPDKLARLQVLLTVEPDAGCRVYLDPNWDPNECMEACDEYFQELGELKAFVRAFRQRTTE